MNAPSVPSDLALELRVLGAAMANAQDGVALVPLLRLTDAWWHPAHAELADWLAKRHALTGRVPAAKLRAVGYNASRVWMWTVEGAPSDFRDVIDRARSNPSVELLHDGLALIDLAVRRQVMRACSDTYGAASESIVRLGDSIDRLMSALQGVP